MEKIVRTLWNVYGYGFAYVRRNEETGLYRGTCSNGNSTKAVSTLGECVSALYDMGYSMQNVRD